LINISEEMSFNRLVAVNAKTLRGSLRFALAASVVLSSFPISRMGVRVCVTCSLPAKKPD
jgi:hypothetical protein